MILANAKCDIKVEVDKNRFRPIDVPIIEANITKLNNITGWKPEIDLNQTIIDTLNYWRNK